MIRSRRSAPPARLFFGVITGYPRVLGWARSRLRERFGTLDPDADSPVFPFPETRTYARSMGPDLRRQFFFLAAPVEQDSLARVKNATLEIEQAARDLESWPVERPLNIDPGLLNDCRIILASTKDHAHRIYRGGGIWEEITLIWRHGRFESLPWTYPDFRQPTYHEYFGRLRRAWLARASHGGRPRTTP